MNRRIRNILHIILLKFASILSMLFGAKNDTALMYSDSRALVLNSWWTNRNIFCGYPGELMLDARWTFKICPEQHTTLIDFLYEYHKKPYAKFGFILLHVGVVDFSPRPISDAKNVLDRKIEKIEYLFGEEVAQNAEIGLLRGDRYCGELTATIYNESIRNSVFSMLSDLCSIEKIIFITTNPIDLKWSGSYFRRRPSNINDALNYEQDLISRVKFWRVLNLRHLSESTVKLLTTDNIHFSNGGHAVISASIKGYIEGSR